MKRYIRASISESTPDWLRKELTRRGPGYIGNSLKSNLINKYNIALDKATYHDSPTDCVDPLPIYLLRIGSFNYVYCPGVNDDETANINGRYRKLGSIAKSKLNDMAEDVVYIDRADGESTFEKQFDRYRDPRRTYRYNSGQGDYAGQYRRQKYNYDTGTYEDVGWSERGMTPSNESRARDKSGYKIPTPEERLQEYYERFPDRITNKVDVVYDRLVDMRNRLNQADFRDTNINLSRAYRRFSDAVDDYKQLLKELDDKSKADARPGNEAWSQWAVKRATNSAALITERLNDVERLLNGDNVL